jgi:hypothetical protein
MKFWKHTLITAFAFLGISTSVLYTSCTKDQCADLKCQNNGTCTDGLCTCPTGYEGAECEMLSSDRFTGTYYGTSVTSKYPVDVLPTLFDTVVIFTTPEPNRVAIVRMNTKANTPNYTRDTLYGFINGRKIDIDSVTQGNYKRYATAVLNTGGLTYQTEEVTTIDTSVYKTVITFVGPRAYK